MNKKIIGILVCMLMTIATVIPVAVTANERKTDGRSPPPEIVGDWKSLATHGGLGELSITLDKSAPCASASCEPRFLTPPIFGWKLQCTFSEPVDIGGASVSAVGLLL